MPSDLKPELVASHHYRVTDTPFVFTNGTMAAHVEVDIETGMVKILNFLGCGGLWPRNKPDARGRANQGRCSARDWLRVI